MFHPIIYIFIILFILFLFWFFFGGKSYDFIGLKPLDPKYINDFNGSIYNWTSNSENLPIDNTPKISDKFTCPKCYELLDNNNICIKCNKCNKPPICFNKNSNKFVSKGERICRETLEKIYDVPFINVRPDWLINPETNRKLELDCYNKDLKIAVEYNGIQHYKWPNFTQQTYESFINQVRRDELKYKLCNKYGVYLIVVPYNVSFSKIPDFIISHLPDNLQARINSDL